MCCQQVLILRWHYLTLLSFTIIHLPFTAVFTFSLLKKSATKIRITTKVLHTWRTYKNANERKQLIKVKLNLTFSRGKVGGSVLEIGLVVILGSNFECWTTPRTGMGFFSLNPFSKRNFFLQNSTYETRAIPFIVEFLVPSLLPIST